MSAEVEMQASELKPKHLIVDCIWQPIARVR